MAALRNCKWSRNLLQSIGKFRTRQIGFGPGVGSFFWPGALGATWIADPQDGLMATLMIQLLGASRKQQNRSRFLDFALSSN
jgi:hypothetical protein